MAKKAAKVSNKIQPAPADERQSGIEDEMEAFKRNIDAICSLRHFLDFSMGYHRKVSSTCLLQFAKSNGFLGKENAPLEFPAEELNEVTDLLGVSVEGSRLLPCSLLVTLVSQFDLYLGRVARWGFLKQPATLNSLNASLSFQQLMEFDSMKAAQEHVLSKEIDNSLRGSHELQIDWLEKRFCIEIRKKFSRWAEFIELTERRNLFVHCDGKVSPQYRGVCKKHMVQNVPEINATLDAPLDYFEDVAECIFDLGLRIGYLLWRKLDPNAKDAEDYFCDLLFTLVKERRFDLAISLGKFALEQTKLKLTEDTRRRIVMNVAQAFKWSSRPDQMTKMLNEDWSACANHFQLALHVLRDEFDQAAAVMCEIGRSERISGDCHLALENQPGSCA